MNAPYLLNLPVLDAGEIGRDGGTRLRAVRAGGEVALPLADAHMPEAPAGIAGGGGKAGQVAGGGI